MREPAEAGDDVAVSCPALDASFHVGVPGRIGLPPQFPQEPEPAVLFGDGFGMMERVAVSSARV